MNKINIYNNTVSHKFNFRLVNDFKIPLHRINIAQRALLFSGPKLWNYIPGNLKGIN